MDASENSTQTPDDAIAPAIAPPDIDMIAPAPEPVPVETALLEPVPAVPARHGWTLATLGAGLAILSACILIPAIDANRQLQYQHQKLAADKNQVDQQIAVNDEFLKKTDDPQLIERLAQRQMRVIPEGTAVLHLSNDDDQRLSPFALVDVPAPAPLPAYTPAGGILADWCLNSKRQMGLIAAGLFLVAIGLVCGPTNE